MPSVWSLRSAAVYSDTGPVGLSGVNSEVAFMFISTVSLSEPYLSALASDRPWDVCDAKADTAEEFFARAQARIAVGREAEARHDLDEAGKSLGDECLVEKAFLDLRERRSLKTAAATAELVSKRAVPGSILAARALHLLGLAQAKSRRTSAAADSLLAAAESYGRLGQRVGVAQVYDTLAATEAARGRLDYALGFYSMSLVDKTLLGDRQGMAITLGSLGRVHLRLGRMLDALHCFQRDLELSESLGDLRGQCRMHEDIARAYLGLEEHDKAHESLTKCLDMAASAGFRDLEFFARKDAALLRLAQRRSDEAVREVELARAALAEDAEPHLYLVLEEVWGEVLTALGDMTAVDTLRRVVAGFETAELPDYEIPARIALARACMKWGLKATAGQCLARGLRLARRDGYARYLPVINEAMTALDLVESAIDESDRGVGESVHGSRYVIRRQLGSGAFGDVFHVYDPERGHDVALKQLRLADLYDVRARQALLESARVELEAASRVRHPGIARVFAIGSDSDGSTYVVQELIAGTPLASLIPKEPTADPVVVATCIERIANALEVLHEAGVIHRDLKPCNIIMREGNYPVLVDFGVARVRDLRGEVPGRVVGSLAYMAPEQAKGADVDARADIYSLGVVAYEWLAGRRPVEPMGNTFAEKASSVATTLPEHLSHLRDDLHGDFEAFVMSLLCKSRSRRPATAAEVASTCRALLRNGAVMKHGSPQQSHSSVAEDPSGTASTRKLTDTDGGGKLQ